MTQQGTAALSLESGDRMSQAEFHERYEHFPRLRADLIDGVVYVASPTRFDLHDTQAFRIRTWLGTYVGMQPEIEGGNDATLILDDETEVQPDGFLFFPNKHDSPTIDDAHYLHGAPHLVVEVAASSLARDLGPKLRAYERHGVREYIVWRVEQQAIDWFELRDGPVCKTRARRKRNHRERPVCRAASRHRCGAGAGPAAAACGLAVVANTTRGYTAAHAEESGARSDSPALSPVHPAGCVRRDHRRRHLHLRTWRSGL
ncbi:hypothetical protein AYO38_03705 [bacterium SCGC AG-212-C10]|nr:hypothetical protein AYO38_03705 [bacterium SCGC AG-212-C10]